MPTFRELPGEAQTQAAILYLGGRPRSEAITRVLQAAARNPQLAQSLYNKVTPFMSATSGTGSQSSAGSVDEMLRDDVSQPPPTPNRATGAPSSPGSANAADPNTTAGNTRQGTGTPLDRGVEHTARSGRSVINDFTQSEFDAVRGLQWGDLFDGEGDGTYDGPSAVEAGLAGAGAGLGAYSLYRLLQPGPGEAPNAAMEGEFLGPEPGQEVAYNAPRNTTVEGEVIRPQIGQDPSRIGDDTGRQSIPLHRSNREPTFDTNTYQFFENEFNRGEGIDPGSNIRPADPIEGTYIPRVDEQYSPRGALRRGMDVEGEVNRPRIGQDRNRITGGDAGRITGPDDGPTTGGNPRIVNDPSNAAQFNTSQVPDDFVEEIILGDVSQERANFDANTSATGGPINPDVDRYATQLATEIGQLLNELEETQRRYIAQPQRYTQQYQAQQERLQELMQRGRALMESGGTSQIRSGTADTLSRLLRQILR